MLQNKVRSGGIIYVGDGAFGTLRTKDHRKHTNRFYLNKRVKKSHFILVDIDTASGETHLQAIDENDQVFDKFEVDFPRSTSQK